MFNYLDDEAFVEFVLEKGSIPFIIRGDLECEANFNFAPVAIRVSGPTLYLSVFGENAQQEVLGKYFVNELTNEAVFPGEIDLPEKTIKGISMALFALEMWADFLCLAVGNPKIKVEVQRPLNAIIVSRHKLEVASLDRWARLVTSHLKIEKAEGRKVASALWWYRKACSTAYYSTFDSYTANWNALEILCSVSGGKINKGPQIDKAVQDYLKDKEVIEAKDIAECYNKFVNYSIASQMKDALKIMLGEEQATQIVYQCFQIKPDKDRLYQIRNDINHGNIRENSLEDYERVYLRGMLLSEIVMTLLCQKLGYPISLGIDINTLAKSLANPPWRKEKKDG